MVSLATPVESAPKVSRKIVPALKRLGIKTIRDLLLHLPSRYEDFSNIKNIEDVRVGEVVTVAGVISKVNVRWTSRRGLRIVDALVRDQTGKIKVVWYNQPYLARSLKEGGLIRLSGKVVKKKEVFLQNPSHEKILNTENGAGIHTGGLVSIYPETTGVTSRWLRFLIYTYLPLRTNFTDPLPKEIRKAHALPEIQEALRQIHAPKNLEEAEQASRRFRFENILLLQLRALLARARIKQYPAPVIPTNIELLKKFVASLPFGLTDAQRRSIWEIVRDIAKPRPMNRLLEGDVGSGKTIVAASAAVLTVQAGYKVAFMAPTEILAQQHFMTLEKSLAPFKIRIGLLTGSEKRAGVFEDIIVGTHALIQKNMKFNNLALVIVDEQHRFGVEQRALLQKRKGPDAPIPHFLSMSATPIPRTLALALYGDLDLSLLDQMPKSRKPIMTRIVQPSEREHAYQFIREEVRRGRQAFVVCPRIELAEKKEGTLLPRNTLFLEAKAVKEEYQKLSQNIFPDLRVGMLHGKMRSKEKALVMRQFSASGGKNRELDILVSTSVIEVGVDVPNATIMMIEGAERFGLAQLHQFRGRVGRGAEQSYCFLFTTDGGPETRRLKAMAEYQDGFKLAEQDLKIRGAGDLFGTRQSGIPDGALSALSDPALIREAREAAIELLKYDPKFENNRPLKSRLDEMEQKVHLE